MAKQDDFGKFAQKMGDSVQRRLDNPSYCALCGKPLELVNQGQETFQWELRNQVHAPCARNYVMQRQQKPEHKDK